MALALYTAIVYLLVVFWTPLLTDAVRKYSRQDVHRLREEVREMFQHAYQGYLTFAGDYDELRPLSCDGVNTWGRLVLGINCNIVG